MSLLLSGGTGISLDRFEGGATPEPSSTNLVEQPQVEQYHEPTPVPQLLTTSPLLSNQNSSSTVHHHHDKHNHETKKFYSKLQQGVIGLYLLLILSIMIWFSATLDSNVITQTGTILSIVGFVIYVMFEVIKYRTFHKYEYE